MSVAFLMGVGRADKYSKGLKITVASNNSYCTVAGIGTCTDTEILIPPKYNGIPVTRIKDNAFADNTSIVSVVIPNGVTIIGNYAFLSCSNLKSVTIPASVAQIGKSAFASSGLKSATFEDKTSSWNLYDNNGASIGYVTGAGLSTTSEAAAYLKENAIYTWKKQK